ncbi:1209_t:CDS:2, partial [Funneliformis geosporum]
MKEFLVTKDPLDIVRISTALFVRVEEGEWTGNLKKEERIETELEKINVKNLGFNHPICSSILDIKSEPFTNMPGSVSNIFKEPFQKYKLEQNHDIMEASRGICSDIEELLTSNVNRYYKSKNHQKIKIEANTISDNSNTFSRLDGLKKQLGKREALLRQKENNIKKTIEAQVVEECKCLKDEYDALKDRLEDNLEKQYKSHIFTLEKSIAIKNKEIGKLSTTISQLKNYKNALKKDFASAKKTIKVLDDIIYSKNKTIIAYNEGLRKINPS